MDSTISTKRIAKNTLIIYFQVFVSMIVGLISSRLVLQALGASDYGLYNVVGGVIAMFTFISGAMTSTTTRFLNYEMGKANGDMNRVFNISNVLHICTSVIIFLVLESCGLFYILNYLNVESGKESDAMFVFQVSTIVACVGIINVPYRSIFIAYERFLTIAIVDVANSFIKLLLVILLCYYNGNGLRFYAVCMSVATFTSFVVYHWLANLNWSRIVKWKLVRGWQLYKSQIGFSLWNLMSTMAITARSQGTHILINLFFGTTVNAAYAISRTVECQVNVLSGNFVKVANPQITKLLGSGDKRTAFSLSADISRYNILLTAIVFFTLVIELDYLLQLWLGSILPEGTLSFCQYTLIVAVVSSTSAGIGALITGFGKLMWFKIELTTLFMLSLFVGYVSYKHGMPAYSILLWYIIADILNRIIQLLLLHHFFSLKIVLFLKNALGRPFLFFLVILLYVVVYKNMEIDAIIPKFMGIFLTFFFTCLIAFFIGLNNKEQHFVVMAVRKKLKHA